MIGEEISAQNIARASQSADFFVVTLVIYCLHEPSSLNLAGIACGAFESNRSSDIDRLGDGAPLTRSLVEVSAALFVA